jgi:hypothetical protein
MVGVFGGRGGAAASDDVAARLAELIRTTPATAERTGRQLEPDGITAAALTTPTEAPC